MKTRDRLLHEKIAFSGTLDPFTNGHMWVIQQANVEVMGGAKTLFVMPPRDLGPPIVHGLTEINVWAANTVAVKSDIALIKKAFWFHDAVYKHGTQEASNEEQSAALWLSSRLDAEDSSGSAELIRATDHLQATGINHPLKNILLGADLAILGQANDVYDEYARMIRIEYKAVEQITYISNRRLFLEPYFSELYTQRALENIERELKSL